MPKPPKADVAAARELATAWAIDHQGIAPDDVAVALVSTRAGSPAFQIGRRSQMRAPATGVLVREGQVLHGEEGFATFVRSAGLDDPVAVATAWSVLVARGASEPFGTWTGQGDSDPRWVEPGLLELTYSTGRTKVLAQVRVSPSGEAEVVAERPAP